MRSVAGLVVLCACAGIAAASPVSGVFSGQTFFADLDANGDGPDAADCRFQFTYDPNTSAVTITPVGDTTTLRVCTGGITGSITYGSDSSSDFLDLALATTSAESSAATPPKLASLGLTLVPGLIELIDEAVSGTPDGLPLAVNQIDFRDATLQRKAFVNLCSANGPAAQVRFADGSTALLQLSLYPNAQNPTYLVVPNVPTELAAPNHGTFNPVNYYIPVTSDRRITAVFDLEGPIVIIDTPLDQLRPCPGNAPAPSVTRWGFTGLLLGLLAIGIWRVTIGGGRSTRSS